MSRLIVTSTDDEVYPPTVRVRITRSFMYIAVHVVPPPYTVTIKAVKGAHPSMHEVRLRFDFYPSKPVVLTLTVPETFLNAAQAAGRFMIRNGEFRVHVFLPKQPATQHIAKPSRQTARGAR